MLDDFDIDPLATAGTKWTRRITGGLGVLLGGGLGYIYHGIEGSTGLVAVGHTAIPAVFGFGLGWLFSGWILFGLLLVGLFGAIIGWQYLTGA